MHLSIVQRNECTAMRDCPICSVALFDCVPLWRTVRIGGRLLIECSIKFDVDRQSPVGTHPNGQVEVEGGGTRKPQVRGGIEFGPSHISGIEDDQMPCVAAHPISGSVRHLDPCTTLDHGFRLLAVDDETPVLGEVREIETVVPFGSLNEAEDDEDTGPVPPSNDPIEE